MTRTAFLVLVLAFAILVLPACDSQSFRNDLDDARDKINGK